MKNRKASQVGPRGTPFLSSYSIQSIGAVVITAYSEAACQELMTANRVLRIPNDPIPPISAEAWWDEYHPKKEER